MEHWLQSSLRGSSEEAPPLLEAEAKHPLGDMLAVSSLYMSDNWVADRIWLDGPVDTLNQMLWDHLTNMNFTIHQYNVP